MKWSGKLLILTFFLLQACVPLQKPTVVNKNSDKENINKLIQNFQTDYATLNIAKLELSYIKNLQNLGTEQSLKKQLQVLSSYRDKVALIDKDTLTACSRIELTVIANKTDLGIEQAKLGLAFLQSDVNELSDNGIYHIRSGKQWYRYYLKAWLGHEVAPETLFEFGKTALASAVKNYQTVQAKMGFSGKDAEFQAYLANAKQYQLKDHDKVLELYKEKQKTVNRNLHKLFKNDYHIALTTIKKSDKGMAFPAPGWYKEPNTFYYNVFGNSYNIRQMDWLLVHEATPGHHFQYSVARKNNICQRPLQLTSSAFTEGWAAYVETLGTQLGLYQTPGEQLGAIEWNMIRSARVALDIGINYYGWTNTKAFEFWHENTIGQDDAIALREINRMRNWPAQVITYKYGANMFERMKQHYLNTLGDQGDVRQYHDIALSYGPMPLSSFEQLVHAQVAELGEY